MRLREKRVSDLLGKPDPHRPEVLVAESDDDEDIFVVATKGQTAHQFREVVMAFGHHLKRQIDGGPAVDPSFAPSVDAQNALSKAIKNIEIKAELTCPSCGVPHHAKDFANTNTETAAVLDLLSAVLDLFRSPKLLPYLARFLPEIGAAAMQADPEAAQKMLTAFQTAMQRLTAPAEE